MKKLLLLIVTAIGATAIQRKLKAQKAEKDLWAEATDSPTYATKPGDRAGFEPDRDPTWPWRNW